MFGEQLVEMLSDGVCHLRVLAVWPVVAPAVLEDSPEIFHELLLQAQCTVEITPQHRPSQEGHVPCLSSPRSLASSRW